MGSDGRRQVVFVQRQLVLTIEVRTVNCHREVAAVHLILLRGRGLDGEQSRMR